MYSKIAFFRMGCAFFCTLFFFSLHASEKIEFLDHSESEIASMDIRRPVCSDSRLEALEAEIEQLNTLVDCLYDRINSTNCELCPQSIICCPRWGCFSLFLDFLYWKANEDGLEFGTRVHNFQALTGTATASLRDLHFEWNPGFRLGVNYDFCFNSPWSTAAVWTHIKNYASARAASPGQPTDSFLNSWYLELDEFTFGATRAKANWNVILDVVDLQVQRNFLVCGDLDLEPFVGLRVVDIQQHYHVKYINNFVTSQSEPPVPGVSTFRALNEFIGVGFRGGLGIGYYLGCGFEAIAATSASILYGQFTVKARSDGERGINSPTSPTGLHSRHLNFWRTRLSFEEVVGLIWKSSLCERCFRYSFRALFEMSQWPSQNQLYGTFLFPGGATRMMFPVRREGNLGYLGFTLGAVLEF